MLNSHRNPSSFQLAEARAASPGRSRGAGVWLDAAFLRQLFEGQRLAKELQDQLLKRMREAGFLEEELARLESVAATAASPQNLASAARESEELRRRLQEQRGHHDNEKRRWQDRLQQQQARLEALERDNAALRSRPTGQDEVDLAGDPLQTSELRNLCRDLNRSLHASQSLQASLDRELRPTDLGRDGEASSRQHEVEQLRQQLAEAQAENSTMRAQLLSRQQPVGQPR